MKRTMYFLLALLVALTLVVGVSCNGDNKTPEDGTKYQKYDLGTEKLVAPEWLYGKFRGTIPGYGERVLTIDGTGITGLPEDILPADGARLTITKQTVDGYTYNLEYELGGSAMTIQVTRQTYEQLEVIYRSEDISNLPMMIFERVQE